MPTPPALARRLADGAFEPAGGFLDPACGEGELLLAAWEASGRDPRVARRLHGLEIDPRRARACRKRLREALGPAAGSSLGRRIRTADALLPDTRWPGGCTILANPPWASLSGRQAISLPADRVATYRSEGPGAGWPSLHGAFLLRIARYVCSEGTRARVLIPASVCDRPGYGPLRSALGEFVRASSVTQLGQGAFPGITESAALIELSPLTVNQPDDPTACWAEAPEGDAVLERMDSFPRLAPQCFGDTGVHTGNAARDLIRRDPHAPGAPLREGRDLLPYRLGPPSARLAIDHEPFPGQRFRIGPLERYTSVGVLLRQTADRPRAARHREPTYFRNTLLACKPPAGLDPAVVLAVLNAPTATLWHRAHFLEARQRAFPQVKIGHLRSQPFPFLERDDSPALHDEIVRHVHALEENGEGRSVVDHLVAEAFGLDGVTVNESGRALEQRTRPSFVSAQAGSTS